MNRTGARRWGMIAGLLAMGGGAMLTLQAIGAAALAGQPTVVVTVNLATVMEKLDQRAEADNRLKALQQELRAEEERRKKQVSDMEAEAKTLREKYTEQQDPAERKRIEDRMQQLQEQAALATLEFQAWYKVASDQVDVEASLSMQDLYKNVKEAAAQMASANRYDLVLVDDSQGQITTSPEDRGTRMDQVRRQIAARRMLYVNPTIDITNDLIDRMNNARRVAGPKPAP